MLCSGFTQNVCCRNWCRPRLSRCAWRSRRPTQAHRTSPACLDRQSLRRPLALQRRKPLKTLSMKIEQFFFVQRLDVDRAHRLSLPDEDSTAHRPDARKTAAAPKKCPTYPRRSNWGKFSGDLSGTFSATLTASQNFLQPKKELCPVGDMHKGPFQRLFPGQRFTPWKSLILWRHEESPSPCYEVIACRQVWRGQGRATKPQSWEGRAAWMSPVAAVWRSSPLPTRALRGYPYTTCSLRDMQDLKVALSIRGTLLQSAGVTLCEY